MIKLRDSQITQILPEILSERESVQALSFALHQAVKKLCHYCENISVFSSIDSAPEKVLDLLAGEMDTQYYDDSLPINVKRQLIKNTLPWYMGTGTPGALEELVTAVYGRGNKVEEWFEYGGKPHFFRVNITNMEVKHGQNEEFRRILNRIKRLSSQLDAIRYLFHYKTCWLIRYEQVMTFAGDFYPRSNIPLNRLDGATHLDGAYPLSRYRSGERVDFYPLALQVAGTVVWRPDDAGGETGDAAALLQFLSQARQVVDSGMEFGIRGGAALALRPAGRLHLSGAAGASPEAGAAAEVCGGAEEAVGSGAGMAVKGEAIAGSLPAAAAARVSGSAGNAGAVTADAGLVVEKDWLQLDGSRQLDGSWRLDAARYAAEM